MIGHRFNNGAQVIAMAPSLDDTYVLLMQRQWRRGNDTMEDFITGKVAIHAVLNPDEWSYGNYHERLDEALTDFIERSALARDAGPVVSANLMRLVNETRIALAVTCKHCGRHIVRDAEEGWIDPLAGYDDEDGDGIWRTTCDAHDTFIAEHEPQTH